MSSVCVYCGSRHGTTQAFVNFANALGARLARTRVRLVYGGGDVGLMGVLARSCRDAGGEVTGVIPEFLREREVGIKGIEDLVVVDSMHTRKMVMFERSDAFVVLPGGIGTLDETFEMLTWRQLGLHAKPIYLVNLEGFWEPLLHMLDHMVERGFLDGGTRDHLIPVDSLETLLTKLGIAL